MHLKSEVGIASGEDIYTPQAQQNVILDKNYGSGGFDCFCFLFQQVYKHNEGYYQIQRQIQLGASRIHIFFSKSPKLAEKNILNKN